MRKIEKTNNEDIVENMGYKIYKLRKENNMTQDALAKAVYVSNKTISKWENGNSSPSYGSLKDMARVFKVNVSYFLDDKTPKGRLKFFYKLCIEFIKNYWHQTIFTILFILLLIYFLNTFDTLAMYEIVSDDNIITFDAGYYARSKSDLVITINNIKYENNDKDIISQKIKLYTMDNNDKIYFYESNNLEDIQYKDLIGYRLTRYLAKQLNNNLYLEIENLNKDNSITTYEIKLGLKKKIASDKFFYNNKANVKDKIENNNSIKIDSYYLDNQGYKKIDAANIFYKDFKKYRLYFDLDLEKMFYSIDTKDGVIYYSYYYNKDMIEFNENEKINFKHYTYMKNSDELNCMNGDCADYLEIYEEIIAIYKKAFN